MLKLRILTTAMVVAAGVMFSSGCGKEYSANNDDPDAGLKVKGVWEAGVETADGPERERD